MIDLGELSGDAGDLLEYRLDEHGFHPAVWLPPVGRSCIVITCEAPGFASLHAKFWQNIDELEPEPAPACTQCGSTNPGVILGLPFCPNDFHFPAVESDWRRIAAYAAGIATIGAWLLALFLYAAGVIN